MPAAATESSGKVIELSVEETNKLRASLGLAPLRLAATATQATTTTSTNTKAPETAAKPDDGGAEKEEVLVELSVEESNALRASLGLPPLRTDSSKSSKPVVHAPARNIADDKAAVERVEQARLKRAVDTGMSKFADAPTLGETETSVQSWAEQMRKQQQATKKESKKKKSKQKSYDQDDLQGLQVAHAVSELQEGSTTVLTLADAPLLATADDPSQKVLGLNTEDQLLENVQLAEARERQTGLQEKRKLELGLGRAGGYAGFDDDEFEELGGTQGPSRQARGAATTDSKAKKKVRGFEIGAHLQDQEEQLQQSSDLFAGLSGQAVSLQTSQPDTAAADYMTLEEDEAARQKKKKESTKFKKKKKKKKDKKKKNKRMRHDESDEEEEEEKKETSAAAASKETKGLAEELEATAAVVNTGASSSRRKRRREDDDDDGDGKPASGGGLGDATTSNGGTNMGGLDVNRRAKYDSIMSKGNERTRNAFGTTATKGSSSKAVGADDDEEPDDAFLNAALAKARRLNRLKAMSAPSSRGADAVVEAVKSAQQQPSAVMSSSSAAGGGGTIEFSVDETREFTRALRARTEQTKRSKKKDESGAVAVKQEEVEDGARADDAVSKVKDEDEPMEEDVDLHELAKEVKEDPEESSALAAGLDGTTGATVSIGRGVGSVLGLLKQTGEMTRKNAGKEEMRGRAKDKKTYEDYEPLNLSEVVRIDEGTATAQDRDLASREVKLEYRDKHGRLLTRKEAFRELSYAFHGYGSGKRKEEKRMQQIAREQAEARLASRQAAEGAGAGTFGALKATQKATGKAFVVHKTQN